MAVPKPKPTETKPEEETKRQVTLDDIDDPELLQEIRALEAASIEDFLRLEAELDSE